MKIVQAAAVDITPRNPGREIKVTNANGGVDLYMVTRAGGEGDYTVAYVENEHGQTTQIVRP